MRNKVTVTKLYIIIFVLALSAPIAQGNTSKKTSSQKSSIQFALSEMKRFPHAWQLDYGTGLYFGYTQGLGCLAMLKLYDKTGDTRYLNYVKEWTDSIINENGDIYLYNPSAYNIDYINSGKVLLNVYQLTKENKYKYAIETLIHQLSNQPKTTEGGYWHKKIYPHQIWLDGIYMASPFMAQYGKDFQKTEWIDEAIQQITLCYKRTIDNKTGLLYHAWDESKIQKWADPVTGHSPNFWGRSIGWYFMAVVDALDYTPENHPRRQELISIAKHLTLTMSKYQSKRGLWYQVINLGDRNGNYEEASVSAMCMYAIAKSANKGYADKKYLKTAIKAYNGINKYLIRKDADGTLNLTHCCAVAGLGGNPYRDGSYEYYIHEKIRENDAKATGPYIMGCLELDK